MRPFDKAKLFITKGILEELVKSIAFAKEVITSVSRFARKDWGDTSPEDVAVNEDALEHADRVLAAYSTSKGKI